MTHRDIIAHLCQLYPPQVVHEITTENIISSIVRRMGEEALQAITGRPSIGQGRSKSRH